MWTPGSQTPACCSSAHLSLVAADRALVRRQLCLPLPLPLPLGLQLGLGVGDGRLGLLPAAATATVAGAPGPAPLVVLRSALQEGGEDAREAAAGGCEGSRPELRLLLLLLLRRGGGGGLSGGAGGLGAALLRLFGWPLATVLLLLLAVRCLVCRHGDG